MDRGGEPHAGLDLKVIAARFRPYLELGSLVGMEHLWSRADATSRDEWKVDSSRKRFGYAETVAAACHRSQTTRDGKEGVDGSSPSEGLQNPAYGNFRSGRLALDPACGGYGAVYGAFKHGSQPPLRPFDRRPGPAPGTIELSGLPNPNPGLGTADRGGQGAVALHDVARRVCRRAEPCL
jgi:hypothetical protein